VNLKPIPKLALTATAAVSVLAAPAFDVQAQSAASPAPTDPQIAAIVVTANQVDIDAGNLALKKSGSKDVKAFAQTMVRDHTGVNQAAVDLVHKLNVTPESNATSESLKQGGDENLAKLKGLSGKAFDKAYIDHEVAYHQAVLDAMDKTLIPDAKNAELKALLVKVRPAFVAHLDHAKHLDEELDGSGGY
jgi:putative membrane protein